MINSFIFRYADSETSQQTFVLMKTSFVFVFRRRLQDVFKTSWSRPIYSSWPYVFKTSSRRLQDVFKTSSRRLAKTSSRHLQDVFKTFWRRLQDIFKTSCKDIFKTFSRRTIRLNCLPRSHLWEIYGQCRKFVSVLKFIKFYHNSMVLVFHFTGT